MQDDGAGPSDDELIRFAAKLLGPPLADDEALGETVLQARDLWLLLYRAGRNPPAPGKPPG